MKSNLTFTIAKSLLLARWKQTLVAAIGVTFSITMFITLLGFMNGLNELLDGLVVNRTPHIRLYNEIKPSKKQPIEQLENKKNTHHFIRSIKPNLDQPEQIWVSDITYVGNRENPMYLALVTDAYSKQIMGHDLSNSLDVSGSLRALKMAIKKRKYKTNVVTHHSDRGLQYCSNQYQEMLKRNKINCSMTESYDPYANAIAERVNGILKAEFIGYKNKESIETMEKLVKNSIDIYNEQRPHYSCFYLTPIQMHSQNRIKIKTYKNKYPSKNVSTGI